jgi:hypothetical protein
VILSRRTALRGAGILLALPFLEAMRPRRASAQTVTPKRFVAFFMPNGTDPGIWHPQGAGKLTAADLKPAMADLNGSFAKEGEWPAGGGSIIDDVTLVSGVDHQGICTAIHSPAMALCAHKDGGEPSVPKVATLDQYLAERIAGTTPFKSLTFSATTDTEITQGFLSFRTGGQTEAVFRNPKQIFDTLFKDLASPSQDMTQIRARKQSVLDFVKEDAKRLQGSLGAADQQRVEQHLQSVFELEKQLQTGLVPGCTVPEAPGAAPDMHTKMKQMVDLGVLALSCDLTRVLVLQYSNSWALDFKKYSLSDGVADWSDHFISHKLGDRDRATDLDSLPADQAKAIADARVLQTSRFKVRRFTNLINQLKATSSGSGSLLDESLVLYTSENGDGDSHGRKNMPIMLAGHAGGFETGRRVEAANKPTGALHGSILNYLGVETAEYGDPISAPIVGL